MSPVKVESSGHNLGLGRAVVLQVVSFAVSMLLGHCDQYEGIDF